MMTFSHKARNEKDGIQSNFKLVETKIIIQMVRVINKMNMEGQSEDNFRRMYFTSLFSLKGTL